MLMPYNKNLQVYTCPNRVDQPFFGWCINVNSSNDDYPGAPTPPGNWFDGRCPNVQIPGQGPISQAQMVGPATTIWFYDSNPSIFQSGLNTWANLEALAASNPAQALSLENDGSQTIAQLFLTGNGRIENSIIKNPHRHQGGMNIGFCDGHSKWMKPSAIPGTMWNIEQIPQPVE